MEGLVDISITENDVAYCGHSKQNFGGEYANLERELFIALGNNYQSLKYLGSEGLREMLERLNESGLRPSTLGKICDGFADV